MGMGGSEIWIRPLKDGSFAVVLFNKGIATEEISVFFDGEWHAQQDFYPAKFQKASVRDLLRQKDLGVFQHNFTTSVRGNDAIMLKVMPEAYIQAPKEAFV